MGEFIRTQLPEPATYYDGEGLTLKGPGKWKTTLCVFHTERSPSLRVNTDTGGFRCMGCGAGGGDVLAFHMARHGLEFVEAARALGAYREDGKAHRGQSRPTTLSARHAIQVAREDMLVCALLVIDASHGKPMSDVDREAAIRAAARIELIAEEFA